MVFPFRKRRKPPEVDPADADHLFDAVPEPAPDVEAAEDSTGCLQLKRELPPAAGVVGTVASALGFRKAIRVNLDERGTAFWRLIDGRTPLRRIETAVRKQWHVAETDSRRATVQFVKMLMARRLLNLRVPRPEAPDAH